MFCAAGLNVGTALSPTSIAPCSPGGERREKRDTRMRYDGRTTPQSRKVAYLMNPRADTYERVVRALRAAERRTRLYGGGPRFSRRAEGISR